MECFARSQYYSELLGFRTLSISLYSKDWRLEHFGKWVCFRPQVSVEACTLLGPLQNANLNHWTSHASVTTAMQEPENKLCLRDVTQEYEIKIVIKHAQI
jgi:hypothetical protein